MAFRACLLKKEFSALQPEMWALLVLFDIDLLSWSEQAVKGPDFRIIKIIFTIFDKCLIDREELLKDLTKQSER